MQEKQLFEYAIIRVVPRVERGEFLNVGVILYCASKSFLQIKYALNKERLLALSPEIEFNELTQILHAFEQICKGAAEGGPIAQLPLSSRFRWLTAARSTVIQTSPVHPGLCSDMNNTLDKLYAEMVA
ncbi:MAG TPA: DUF3037 domain-containing protein [Panacibacter sp.]|nr:DUF3037 domain-containing protein [Panacibacter sp.]HNP44027.1 DUF3037 domain-containing protein [Panacibacter sp.]